MQVVDGERRETIENERERGMQKMQRTMIECNKERQTITPREGIDRQRG